MEVVGVQSTFNIPNFARGLNILVVDDDMTSLMHLAALLEQYTYKITVAELATVALSMIEEEEEEGRFKLVMTTINLQDMDGFKFMTELSKKNIPFIAISSERSLSATTKAMHAGACLCLEKPISLDDLKNIWQYVFKKMMRSNSPVQSSNVNRKKSRVTEEQDEERKAKVSKGDVMQGATFNLNTTAVGSKEKDQVFKGAEDLDVDNPQHIVDDPRGKGKVIEMEVLEDGINHENMPMAVDLGAGGDKGKQAYEVEGFDLIMKEAETTAVEKEKQDEFMIPENHIKSGLMRIDDGGSRINNEKGKEIADDKGTKEETEKPNNTNVGSTRKKSRLIWNNDLQRKFMAAISSLGDEKARPKKILELMNVSDLSKRQVSSHLQRYKAQIRRACDNINTDSSPLKEAYAICDGNIAVSLVDNTISMINNQGNPMMATGPLQGGRTEYRGYFTIDKVADAIKLATTSSRRNQNLNSIEVPNPTSENVLDTINCPTNFAYEDLMLDIPEFSNPNPADNQTNDQDVFQKDLNEVIQELNAIAVSDPQSLSNYTHILNILEEDEPTDSNGLSVEPDPEEVARYTKMLQEILDEENNPKS